MRHSYAALQSLAPARYLISLQNPQIPIGRLTVPGPCVRISCLPGQPGGAVVRFRAPLCLLDTWRLLLFGSCMPDTNASKLIESEASLGFRASR